MHTAARHDPWKGLKIYCGGQFRILARGDRTVRVGGPVTVPEPEILPAPYAYAHTNEREYFAELTEAYFGWNSYFPFTKEELESYDPEGYNLIENSWEQ